MLFRSGFTFVRFIYLENIENRLSKNKEKFYVNLSKKIKK